MTTKLSSLRNRIEELSVEILGLLNERARQVTEIAEMKKSLHLPKRDLHREAELIRHLILRNQGPLSNDVVQTIFQTIFKTNVALFGEDSSPTLPLGGSLASNSEVPMPTRPITVNELTTVQNNVAT